MRERRETFSYAGEEILVIRKPIRRLHLYVEPPDGHLLITAPFSATRQGLVGLLESAGREWIEKTRRRVVETARERTQKRRRYETGELVPLWGEQVPLQILRADRTEVRLADGRLRVLVPEGAGEEELRAALHAFYGEEVARAIKKYAPLWERRAGRRASFWGVRDMHTRWGSCTPATARIRLSLHLAKHDPEALEYVALHELTHLYERGHTPRFYHILESFCPDWRRIREELNARADFE